MHRYSQDLLRRMLDSGARPKRWDDDSCKRYAVIAYEEAPSCKCGCGEKTYFHSTGFWKQLNAMRDGRDAVFMDYVGFHFRNTVSNCITTTNEEHQLILSAILGDGSLSKPGRTNNYRIVWNMGNKEHAQSKLRMAARFNPSYQERDNPGFGVNWFCVRTACCQIISQYADKYGNSKGIHNLNTPFELDDLGWALYYGDDGHINNKDKICFLHTEGKTEEMVLSIKEALEKHFDIKGGVSLHRYIGGTKKRELISLRMKKDASKKFMQRIKKYMADGVQYKISKDIE